jgi:hypothetical protein
LHLRETNGVKQWQLSREIDRERGIAQERTQPGRW